MCDNNSFASQKVPIILYNFIDEHNVIGQCCKQWYSNQWYTKVNQSAIIVWDVRETWLQVNSSSRRERTKPPEPEVEIVATTLRPTLSPGLGTFRSGSLPNVAAPQVESTQTENNQVPRFWNLCTLHNVNINLQLYRIMICVTLLNEYEWKWYLVAMSNVTKQLVYSWVSWPKQ